MAKRKRQTQQTAYKPTPSTYAVETAGNVLRKYGVTLSLNEVSSQLMDNRSFYKHLLQVPALSIYNEYLVQQCNEMQIYCSEQLINVLFANATFIPPTPESEPILTPEKQQELTQLQTISDELSEKFNETKEQQQQLQQQYDDVAQQKIQDWDTLMQNSADTIVAKLNEIGFTISSDFRERLIKRLTKNGAGLNIPQNTLTSFHIKRKISGIEKAILATLIEENKNG